MASLNGQTIASSYEQLLHTDTDGGGNGNTLVTIKDGDNGTTFGLKLATNKVEVIPSAADDANAFEVSKNDGTAVFTVNSSTPGATLAGTLTATKTLSSDTQTTPETILTLGATYASTGTDGGAGSGSRIEFQIPDDETNPITGAAIAGIKEAADDSDASAGMAFYVSQNDTTLDEMVRIDHDGKFGIGTASPVQKLTVEGDATDGGTGSDGQLVLRGTTNTNLRLMMGMDTSSEYGFISPMKLGTSWNNLSLCYNGGNVGIGDNAPATKLDVNGDIQIQGANAMILNHTTGAASDTYINSPASDVIAFRTGGSERMRITSDGKVGIHTTSPNVGSANSERGVLTIGSTDNGSANNYANLELQGHAISNDVTVGDISFYDHTNQNAIVRGGRDLGTTTGFLSFFTNGGSGVAQRMRIDSSGNVGIGDNPTSSQRFYAKGDIGGGYAATFFNDGNNANRYGIRIIAGTDDGSGNNYHLSAMDGDGDLEGALRVDSGTFSLYDNSDRRLKDNIRDTKINGTDIVNSMKVRDFEWKKNGLTETAGFVAQELKESFEPASPDSEDDLYEGKPKMMAISRDRLVPVLVKAIQELSAKVEALENA